MRQVEVTADTVRVQLENVVAAGAGACAGHAVRSGVCGVWRFWRASCRRSRHLAHSSRAPNRSTSPGRNIGDEYRYIIDRKFARKYPGNMLERPSLLLNPWAIRSTETGQQASASGRSISARRRAEATARGRASLQADRTVAAESDFADLDFLASSSVVVANIEPDKNGVVEFKRADLGPHQQLLFVAVDPQNTVSRIVALPEAKSEYLDLRLAKGLDPKLHYTQQKLISILQAKGTLVVPDITSTHFEAYDSICPGVRAVRGVERRPEVGRVQLHQDLADR